MIVMTEPVTTGGKNRMIFEKIGLINKPISEDIKIDVTYKPSATLSGDMYYWQRFNDGRLGIMLFDVMGHGVSSSLVCMFISSVLREAMEKLKKPDLVIRELNRQMAMLNPGKLDIPFYFTAIYLIVDPVNRSVQYVNAGHPPGFFCADEKESIPLSGGSCAVGFFEDIEITVSTLHYENHFQMLLFTDGIYEAMNLEEAEADLRLSALTSTTWNKTVPSLSDILLENKNQPDDICLMTIQSN